MARIRTIKPEMASDRKMTEVSRDARYTFVLLISQADDDGLVRAEPRQLLGALYPHDNDVEMSDMEDWMLELLGIGVLRWRITRDGMRVVEIVNWSKHQYIKNRSKPFLLTQLVEETETVPPPSPAPTEDGVRPSVHPGGAESRVLSPESRVPRRRDTPGALSPDEQAVIDHYRSVHPKRLRAVPDKTLRLLRKALTSYTVAELRHAIDGNAESQFHRDNNHTGLELVLRDAEKVDYFMAIYGRTEDRSDEWGAMKPYRRNESGEWVEVA